jgi:hypothetical protein
MMNHNDRVVIMYKYFISCLDGNDEMLTGYGLERKFTEELEIDSGTARHDLFEAFRRLNKQGLFTDFLFNKLVENDDCADGYKRLKK